MVAFTVNGKAVDVSAEPDTPLLWAIREHLKLTGTKFGCGIAQCGACTVHINGEPARSCSVLLQDVTGKQVTTIEGLSPAGNHPLQKASSELLAGTVIVPTTVVPSPAGVACKKLMSTTAADVLATIRCEQLQDYRYPIL